jgi:lipooligosaccharide transport system permease protein
VKARDLAFSPRGALRMWQRNAAIGRKTIFTTIGPRFVEAAGYLLIMGLGLGLYIDRIDGFAYVDFIAPGVACSSVMFGSILETTYNAFSRIHIRRVFEAVVTTPLSMSDVVVGEYLWAVSRGTLYGVIFLAVMAAFGLVHSVLALLVPVVFVAGALCFAVIGMAYTGLVSSIEHYNIFFTGILNPMFLFSGIFFPFDRLPQWAEIVGWCLPLSHMVAAARQLVLGGAGWNTAGHIAVLLAVTAIIFPVPLVSLRRRLMT